jgi:quinol monooxygenase YgiN
MARYGLIGNMQAQPGKRDELLAILLEGATLVAAAPGCDLWTVNISPDDPDSIWFYELWRSEADHDASLTDARIRAVIDRARQLIAGFGQRVVLHALGGKGIPGQES